jgi:hypothetical protein
MQRSSSSAAKACSYESGRGPREAKRVDVEMPPLWQLYRLRAGRVVRVEIHRDEDRALEAAGVRE